MRAAFILILGLSLLSIPRPAQSDPAPVSQVVKSGSLEFTVNRLGYQLAGWSRFEIVTKNQSKTDGFIVIGRLTLFSKTKKDMGQAPVFIQVAKSSQTKTVVTVKEKGPWKDYQFKVTKTYKEP